MNMEAPPPGTRAKFDRYAQDYVSLHAQSVAASGEQPDYFAQYKIGCLERLLGAEAARLSVLDYGCGVGMLTRRLVGRFAQVHGFDPSGESLEKARAEVPGATFHDRVEELENGAFDLTILSGVLHHVPPAERASVLSQVQSKLRPGSGRIVVFEHNPLNPLTRRAVAMCPYDDDAILLGPREAERLLVQSGFREVRRDFIVFFPKPLAFLRDFEPRLKWLPLGAQMMFVGRRPA